MRFEPVGSADVGADDTRFGRTRLGGQLTAWAADGVRRGRRESLGLAGESLLEDLLGQGNTDGRDGTLQRREGGAPGRTSRSVEAVHQIFGDALEVNADISDG